LLVGNLDSSLPSRKLSPLIFGVLVARFVIVIEREIEVEI